MDRKIFIESRLLTRLVSQLNAYPRAILLTRNAYIDPEKPPQILGMVTSGENTQKDYGTHILACARAVLNRVFAPGGVCIFDLLQELEKEFGESPYLDYCPSSTDGASRGSDDKFSRSSDASQEPVSSTAPAVPEWVASSTVTFRKSVFLARACPVSSPSQAKAVVDHLLVNDKRVAKATHNITAYRIRSSSSLAGGDHVKEICYQDQNDDGETAAGGRLLHLLQLMEVWGVCLVVSRWYGGVQLGPDRFRIISQVAREAILEGGWLKGGGRKSG